jgi:hypothetical protein
LTFYLFETILYISKLKEVLEMKRIKKIFPIMAGKTQDKIKKIGYKIVEFSFDSEEMDCLISEKEIKRVIF